MGCGKIPRKVALAMTAPLGNDSNPRRASWGRVLGAEGLVHENIRGGWAFSAGRQEGSLQSFSLLGGVHLQRDLDVTRVAGFALKQGQPAGSDLPACGSRAFYIGWRSKSLLVIGHGCFVIFEVQCNAEGTAEAIAGLGDGIGEMNFALQSRYRNE